MTQNIDGVVGANGGSVSSFVFPGLTTTQANDVITVFYAQDGTAEGPTTVTSPHLTFTKRAVAPGSALAEWEAIATAPLTSEVITVTFGGSVSYYAGCAFGASGCSIGPIYDSNVSLPVQGNASADPTFSTSANTTMVIAGIGAGAATPTPGSGWTTIYNGGSAFFIAMYQIFSTPQTGTTAALSAGSGLENRYVVDALLPAAGGQPYMRYDLQPLAAM